jgi:hypothetical protein
MQTEHPRYTQRTVEWGHWGITFMEPQPDRSKNFGVIAGQVGFGVGACGPVDGCLGSLLRRSYQDMCEAWISRGVLPLTEEPAK